MGISTRGWLRVLRVVINSIGFIMMLATGLALWNANPLISILFFLAAFDQLEDVYTYTTGRRLIPKWLAPLDILLESVLFAFALALLILSVFYYAYFATWFFKLMIGLSIMIMWSSVEDAIDVLKPKRESTSVPTPATPVSTTTLSTIFVVRRDEVREKAFVKRRR